MATTIDRLWADYEEHHRTEGNKYSHMIGIPLIIVGVLAMLTIPLFTVGSWPVEVSLLVLLASAVVDISLDAKLGTLMLVVTLALYLGARLLGWKTGLALFILGWIFQFVGHGVYEKRRPAFYKNLAHLVVGPLWVLNHFVHLRHEAPASRATGRG